MAPKTGRIKLRVLSFYLSLSKQMMQRFFSYGTFKKLELLGALDSVHVFEGKSKSIIPLVKKFS